MKAASRSRSSSSSSSSSSDRRNLVSAYVNNHHYKASSKDELRPTAASFSLRSVKSMLSIIREYGRDSHDNEPEAIFFLKGAVKLNLNIPSRTTAYSFAIQYNCSDITLSTETPLAIHHAWKYYDNDKVSMWVNSFVIQSKGKVASPAIDNPTSAKGSDTKATTKLSTSTSVNTAVNTGVTTSIKGDSSIFKAWEIIHNSDLIIDRDGLKAILDEQGLQEADDLKLVEHSVLLGIAETLKPIPKNKFLKAMNK
jgi:hypothetical protein